MDQFQKQVQQQARERFNQQLPEWLTEASRKDMNSRAALEDLIGRVFMRGVRVGLELTKKVTEGEL